MSSRDEEAKNVRLFDNRTVERNIKKGLITRKDYDKYLKSLPDATAKALTPGEALAGADEDLLDDDLDEDEDEDEVSEAPPNGASA